MAEYDLDEYGDYEDDVGEYEEEGGEYEEEEEEEEEEERLPTQEEIEYLELRQKLKESYRKKMKKEPSSDIGNSREKKSKMPYDNFGSFFGPSQPVIAQRVIQESKSLLENPHLAERISKAKNVQNNKGGSSTPIVSKPRPNGQQPIKVKNLARPKAKIQMLKNTRDYSFLLSDDAELPIPKKNPPKSVPPSKPEIHSSQRQPTNSGRKVINGHHEERKPLPISSQMRPKAVQQSQRPTTASKLPSTSLDSRKQVGRNEGSGPGRPSGQKPIPSKMLPATVNKSKVIPPPVSRGSLSTGHKPQPSIPPPPPVHKKPLEKKRDDRRPTMGNISRKPMVSSKPQIKQQLAKPPVRPPASSQQKERLLKRPARPFDDDEDDGDKAISMIRNMFGYNPNRYRGVSDDDDSDMEAGFDDIMMEEKRSARIAAKEDEEELKKIEEEERRERMRKAAKKRKLSQR